MSGPINVNDLIIIGAIGPESRSFPSLPWVSGECWSSFAPELNASTFWPRPRPERGHTWITVPELGLDHHHVSRDHLLISPPALPVHGEQEEAEGTVANFSFDSRFFESLAGRWVLRSFFRSDLGTIFLRSISVSKRCAGSDGRNRGTVSEWPALLRAARPRLGAEGPGDRARSARPSMACCDRAAWRPPRCPTPGSRFRGRDFFSRTCDHGADEPQPFCAHVSRIYRLHAAPIPAFGASESCSQTYRARQLGLPLAEIAAASGFCDQAHLSRHFRRVFGTTPAVFRAQHNIVHARRSKQLATARQDDRPLSRSGSVGKVSESARTATGRF